MTIKSKAYIKLLGLCILAFGFFLMSVIIYSDPGKASDSMSFSEANSDPDRDGILTIYEDLNGDGNPKNDDTDGDGIPNYLDTDDDNDGFLTAYENEQDNQLTTFIYVTEGIISADDYLLYDGEGGSIKEDGRVNLRTRALFTLMADGLKILRAKVHKPLKDFKWAERPSGIFISKGNQEVYAILPKSNQLFSMNTFSHEVHTIPGLGRGSTDMVFHPTKRLAYVTNSVEDTVQVIDLEKKKVQKTYFTGSMPSQLIITDDGKHLFISNQLDQTVSKINTTTGREEKIITINGIPYGLMLSRDGTELFVADIDHHRLLVFNTKTYNKKTEVKVGRIPYVLKMDLEGKMLFVTNRGDNTVSMIDIQSKKELGQVKVGKQPSGIAIRPENDMFYVANELSETLSLVDISSQKVVQTIPIGVGPNRVVLGEFSKYTQKQ